MEMAAFIVLASMAVVSALVVITHRRPVVCAIALAFNLVTIAGFYFLLNAQFIALLQILVYAGAIMVLILFVIMLLDLKQEKHLLSSGFFQRWVSPLLAGLLLTAILIPAVRVSTGDAMAPSETGFGTVSSVGTELFGRFFYPFEVISLLLVVAMVGAVILAKRRI